MRLLADKNVPLPSIRVLRQAGWDVNAVAEFAPGARDTAVLAHAAEHAQILITFDRDFGELIYRRGVPAPSGVIYLRLIPAGPEEAGPLLLDLLALQILQLEGHFTVVERERIRQRPLLRAF
ncbi:hypothetical protein BH24GEM2_BH24GEM2_14700 [soil metagenome]